MQNVLLLFPENPLPDLLDRFPSFAQFLPEERQVKSDVSRTGMIADETIQEIFMPCGLAAARARKLGKYPGVLPSDFVTPPDFSFETLRIEGPWQPRLCIDSALLQPPECFRLVLSGNRAGFGT